ncbi:MAG TPA: hypothetical protein VFK32_00075 [Tepidiformaceae bacterium]|nr:hypothetical protein [Tepidiformaceae bacterium]
MARAVLAYACPAHVKGARTRVRFGLIFGGQGVTGADRGADEAHLAPEARRFLGDAGKVRALRGDLHPEAAPGDVERYGESDDSHAYREPDEEVAGVALHADARGFDATTEGERVAGRGFDYRPDRERSETGIDAVNEQIGLAAFAVGHLDGDNTVSRGGARHIENDGGRDGGGPVEGDAISFRVDHRFTCTELAGSPGEAKGEDQLAVDRSPDDAVGERLGEGRMVDGELGDRKIILRAVAGARVRRHLREVFVEEDDARRGGNAEVGDEVRFAAEVDDVVEKDAAVGSEDSERREIVEEGGLVDGVAKCVAGVVDGRGAGEAFVALADLKLAAVVDDVAVLVEPAAGIEDLHEDLPGASIREYGERRRRLGDDHGVVEASEMREEAADEEHQEREMTEERAVVAPLESFGEEVGSAVAVADGFDPVFPAAQFGFDRGGAAFVGEAGVVVGGFEIAVGDFA